MFRVDRFTSEDRRRFLELWLGYEEHVARDLREISGASNWRELMSAAPGLHGLALRDASGGRAEGFALYVFHFCTKFPAKECYLADLYIAPESRAKGGAALLLNALIEECRDSGISRLSWLTKPDNVIARRLYDRLGEGKSWTRYKINLLR